MGIITVSRTHGSGGTAFAESLAQHLGYRFITRTIMNKDNEASAGHAFAFSIGDEGAPSFSSRIQELMSNRSFYKVSLMANIYDYALKNNVVFAGMGAGIVLSGMANVLNFRVVRLLSERVKTIAMVKSIPYDDAFDLVEKMDEGKKDFITRYFDVDVGDATLYHIVLNGSYITVEEGIEIITHYAEKYLTSEHPDETGEILKKRLLEKRAEMLLFRLGMVHSYGKITFEARDNGVFTVRGIIGGEDEKERLFEHLKTNDEIKNIDDHLKVGVLSGHIF